MPSSLRYNSPQLSHRLCLVTTRAQSATAPGVVLVHQELGLKIGVQGPGCAESSVGARQELPCSSQICRLFNLQQGLAKLEVPAAPGAAAACDAALYHIYEGVLGQYWDERKRWADKMYRGNTHWALNPVTA